jgi:hypothetical protein
MPTSKLERGLLPECTTVMERTWSRQLLLQRVLCVWHQGQYELCHELCGGRQDALHSPRLLHPDADAVVLLVLWCYDPGRPRCRPRQTRLIARRR